MEDFGMIDFEKTLSLIKKDEVKEIICYKSKDGQVFETKLLAERRNEHLRLQDDSIEELVDFIKSNLTIKDEVIDEIIYLAECHKYDFKRIVSKL